MAQWDIVGYQQIPRYSWASSSQYGDRYQKNKTERINVCRITAQRDNAKDLIKLILLSHHLDVPVRYDFNTDPQTAYIEVISAERLKKII